MVTYQSDDEQLEALQRWWRENGRSVIAALILAIAGAVGYQQWQAYRKSQAEDASALYTKFSQAINDDGQDIQQAQEAGGELKDDYGGTGYAVLAAMDLAQHYAAGDSLDKAVEQLKWASDHADDDAMEELVRLRLGRVYWAQGNYQQAVKAMGEPPEHGYVSEYYELRGDILDAQGQAADAADAYRKALQAGSVGPQRRRLLQIKLDSVAGPESQS